jgi:hypothetical protein
VSPLPVVSVPLQRQSAVITTSVREPSTGFNEKAFDEPEDGHGGLG